MKRAGRHRCSIAACSSPRRSSTLNIRTCKSRVRHACTQVIGGSPTQTFCGITTNAGKARFRGVELETNFRAAGEPGDGGRPAHAFRLARLSRRQVSAIHHPDRWSRGPSNVADDRKIQNTPKWTLSGTLDYDTPLAGGRLDANTTVAYRSSYQQFEIHTPGLDQSGFALWDANLVWRSSGNRYELGLHGKNLMNKKYITGGYNFLAQDPITGAFILNERGSRSRRWARRVSSQPSTATPARSSCRPHSTSRTEQTVVGRFRKEPPLLFVSG